MGSSLDADLPGWWDTVTVGVAEGWGQCSPSTEPYSQAPTTCEWGNGNLSKEGVKEDNSQVIPKVPISVHQETKILKMHFLRKQWMSSAFFVGCSTIPEVAGEGPKSSIPNLFFPRDPSYHISHPPARVNKKPLPCPWLCLPPSLFSCFPCRIHLQMISLVCILSLAACPPIYQVSAARHRLALSCLLHCSCWPRGRRVWAGGERERSRSPEPAGQSAAGQLGRDNDTARLTAPPPRLALTDDLAGTAALGLPTDISWYNGLDWTCHPGNVGGREIIPAWWK